MRLSDAAFARLVARGSDDPAALARLAQLATRRGQPDIAYRLAREARARAPGAPDILALTAPAFGGSVPDYHVGMVRDVNRNTLFDQAIRRAVRPGDRVLDIGTGTGLLAMMAVRAGAAHVWSCEMVPAVADVAQEVLALNGMADRVTIVQRHSADILPDEIGGAVDVIVSEVMSNNLIGEGVLHTLGDAARRLLRPGGRLIPASGQIMLALVGLGRGGVAERIEAGGFDVTPVRTLERPSYEVRSRLYDIAVRSAQRPIYDFDFALGPRQGESSATVDLVATGGTVDGILLSMQYQLDGTATHRTFPAADPVTEHWSPVFHPLPEPITPAPGTVVRVQARRDATSLAVWAERIA